MSASRLSAVVALSGMVIGLVVAGPTGTQTALALVDGDRIISTVGCDEGPENLSMTFVDPQGAATQPTKTKMSVGASISADGTHIAVAGPGGITVTDPDGTGGALIPGTDLAEFPAWSPDGSEIAFTRDSQLFIVGYQPYAAPAVLTVLGAVTTGLDWSPDGATLLWSSIDSKIVTIEVSGGAQTEIGLGSRAYYSADGTWIAFTASPTGNVASMSADGTNVFVSTQSGTVGGLFGTEAAFRDRHTVNGDLVDYIGSYSFATDTTTTLVDGDIVCDTNFYVWDWGLLRLPTFGDTAYDELFFGDIEWLGEQGITKGCNPPANDRFCPKGTLSRGQIAAFLSRALDLPAGSTDVFTDDDGSVFEDDIDRLASAGITKGCNPPVNDRFCPEDAVTRGQIAALLVRAFGYTDDGGGNLFVDDDGSVFEHDIDRLATAGVTKGCNPPTNDRFCPSNLITREQFAAMLHRALG